MDMDWPTPIDPARLACPICADHYGPDVICLGTSPAERAERAERRTRRDADRRAAMALHPSNTPLAPEPPYPPNRERRD